MECSCTRQGRTLVIRVQGRLDATTTEAFNHEWQSWVDSKVTRVTLDLSDLEYITSAGLRGVVALHKTLKGRHGELALCGLNGLVSEVFAVSGLSFLLPIYKTLEEAVVAH